MHLRSRSSLLLLVLLLSASALWSATWSTGSPTTTNNDDSCDIGIAPAATLLLPFFEVDVIGNPEQARNTVFSVVNVSPYPQIARVTLWTDWAYPVFTFNLFLTGYDVESVDIRDLVVRGMVPTKVGWPGSMSLPKTSNTNHATTAIEDCGKRMPHIPVAALADLRAILTTGKPIRSVLSCPSSAGGEAQVGGNHGDKIAAGYITIDVVATCGPTMPTSPDYYTSEILFDNVLTGDYVVIEPSGSTNGYAGGSPLVHIRAVPEGGSAGSIVPTRLPYTFYDRYTPSSANIPRTIDRRQPLPSSFAARWISGTNAAFETTYLIWREGTIGGTAACDDYVVNSALPIAELVRFDEHENATTSGAISAALPSASRPGVRDVVFPSVSTGDAGGWMFMNLSNGGSQRYSATRAGLGKGLIRGNAYPRSVSQNWVVVNLFAEDRYGVSFDAPWLGNGCSPAMPKTDRGRIAPTANGNP
ncbi:MAG TPA: hypothetical protein VGS96_14090 [Thermoanaerobaculia bacterium]|nr:hypothetical protein [Thermoanaerobaculia bacterium]